MGTSHNPLMHFALEDLVMKHDNLDHLSALFSKDEIDRTVLQMPNDKSTGLDGFNGLFLKSCWNIIKEDFYDLCNDFFKGSLSLQAINTSFITLIPKNNNPVRVTRFQAYLSIELCS